MRNTMNCQQFIFFVIQYIGVFGKLLLKIFSGILWDGAEQRFHQLHFEINDRLFGIGKQFFKLINDD